MDARERPSIVPILICFWADLLERERGLLVFPRTLHHLEDCIRRVLTHRQVWEYSTLA